MTNMQCFKCGAAVAIDDKFCEECGTPLTAIKQPTSTLGCEKCGAELEVIDAEGYCSQCGFRQFLPEKDRLEITINSHLAGVSDRGLKHHRNEDFLAIQQLNPQTQILVVCDGVSASTQPDVAAQTAAQTTCQTLATAWEQGQNPDTAIKSAFAAAFTAVCHIPNKLGVSSDPPSTTIVTAFVQNRTATIAWLGDSRVYWLSNEGCQQLTQDDSWLVEVVAAGAISEAEARQSRNAHAITRWLGADAVEDAIPSMINFTIPGAGYLLLCTDGLWNYAPEPQKLGNLVQQSSVTDALVISRTLVEFARNCGGHDNITVAVLVVS
jgi:serine/threonine protein phosphatase PrpC